MERWVLDGFILLESIWRLFGLPAQGSCEGSCEDKF